MEDRDNDAVLSFDTLYTSNHIQILKVLLPYFEEEQRNSLAVYIKFQEFQYTLEYTKKHTISLVSQSLKEDKEVDIVKLYNSIKPYCTENEKNMLMKIVNLKNSMEKYQEFSKMIPLLESFQSEGSDSGGNFNMNMMLKNFLSEEQIEMFKIFQEGGTV